MANGQEMCGGRVDDLELGVGKDSICILYGSEGTHRNIFEIFCCLTIIVARSSPELFVAGFFHFALTLWTGLLVPYLDVVATAVQTEPAHLASVGWGNVGNDTANNDVLDALAVRA